MNEIRSLLRRPHRSARQMILHPASRRLSNSGVFESRKMRGFLRYAAAEAKESNEEVRRLLKTIGILDLVTKPKKKINN